MKKILTILSITIFFAIAGVVETQAQEETSVGLKAGADLYSLTTSISFFGLSVEETSDSKIGFAAGIFVEKPFSDLLSGQIEALYVQKGGKSDLSGADFDANVDVEVNNGNLTLSYIDIPAMLKINIPVKSEKVSPFIYAGGFAGYLLDASAEADDQTFDELDIKDLLKDLNYGFILGGGANFGAISVDFRYDIGLANLFDSDSELFQELEEEFEDDEEFGDFDDLLNGIEIKTSGFMLTLGYTF